MQRRGKPCGDGGDDNTIKALVDTHAEKGQRATMAEERDHGENQGSSK